MRSQLTRPALHQRHQGAFGGGVGLQTGPIGVGGPQPLGGARQDDRPTAPAGDQVRDRGVDGVPRADQVDVDDRAEVATALVTVGHPDDPGVGDDDVEAAELAPRFGEHGVHRVGIAHVGLPGQDATSLMTHEAGGLLEVVCRGSRVVGELEVRADVQGDDVGALACEFHGVRTTHPAGRAGDEGHLTVE